MIVLTNWSQEQGGIGVRPEWSDSSVHALFSFRHNDNYPGLDFDLALHDRIPKAQAMENRQVLARQLGIPLKNFVFVRQVHQTDVLEVTDTSFCNGAFEDARNLAPADAIVTNQPGIALAIMVADCVPILFYDPIHRAIGCAHSGWRGTVGHIAVNVIDKMKRLYGTRPEMLQVAIGPCMRSCCYEVDEVVYEHAHKEFPKTVIPPRFGRARKYKFNMPGAIRYDLEQAGVMPDCIQDTGLCTSCRVNHLFSHRKEQGHAGRQVGVIAL